MRRAIRAYLRDFIAVVAMIVAAAGIGGYILSNQRLRFPVIEDRPFVINAEFSDAQGVLPGQGQTVRVAGMRVGDIGAVELVEGHAVVRMDLDPEHHDLVHRDATALLRPRTGLKDMFIELDPGTDAQPLMKEKSTITMQNTAPDIDADEVLSVLDTDTRAYLVLLLNGAGKGLKDRGGDLREVFRRLAPLHRDLARINGAVAERRENLARLIHNYGSTISTLAEKDQELSTLVESSERVFRAVGSEDENVSEAVSRLPSTLDSLKSALRKVDTLGDTAGPAFESLRPAVRRIHDANRQILPFAREGEPILREQIRPFVRSARPYVRNLRPSAQNLAQASPDLRESFYELNRFFNMAAHNPGGREPLTGNLGADRARDEGFLFWVAWVTQNGNSVFSTGDAGGPYRRIILLATCTTLKGIVTEEPASEVVMGLTNLLSDASLCPSEGSEPDPLLPRRAGDEGARSDEPQVADEATGGGDPGPDAVPDPDGLFGTLTEALPLTGDQLSLPRGGRAPGGGGLGLGVDRLAPRGDELGVGGVGD